MYQYCQLVLKTERLVNDGQKTKQNPLCFVNHDVLILYYMLACICVTYIYTPGITIYVHSYTMMGSANHQLEGVFRSKATTCIL